MTLVHDHILNNNRLYAELVGLLTLDGEMNLDTAHTIVEKLTEPEISGMLQAIKLIRNSAELRMIRQFEKPHKS